MFSAPDDLIRALSIPSSCGPKTGSCHRQAKTNGMCKLCQLHLRRGGVALVRIIG